MVYDPSSGFESWWTKIGTTLTQPMLRGEKMPYSTEIIALAEVAWREARNLTVSEEIKKKEDITDRLDRALP